MTNSESFSLRNRQAWAWLDALSRSFGCAILFVDPEGAAGPLVGATAVAQELRSLLGVDDPPFMRQIRKALSSSETQRGSAGSLTLVSRRLTVHEAVVGGMAIAMLTRMPPSGSVPESRLLDIRTIESWLTPAVEAHLRQLAPDDEEEDFDRTASLHRRLHDAVDSGSQREVVTAFAEALFAWDGIDVSGYFTDVQGQWMRGMSPPGIARPALVGAEFEDLIKRPLPLRLASRDLLRFGFPPDVEVLAIRISETTDDPWMLLFAEGYRPLNLSRLNLYADLLRDALARLSNIVETRASWAILQALIGETGDPQVVVSAALAEFTRVLDGLSASLIVTSPTGTTLLMAGDRESPTLVRPFDRGNRLVSTLHLPELGTMQLTVRRVRGANFSRREQHLIDRAATIFSAWLPGALKQPLESVDETSSAEGFEAVLDRAASQLIREGLDVSVVVIVVPETESRRAVLQTWVTDIRGRLRGSDLAGAISDNEIGVLLSGTSQEYVPIVCDRLGRSLDLEPGAPTPMGSASRQASSPEEQSIVRAARKAVDGRTARRAPKRPL
jgi:hypothetical protein